MAPRHAREPGLGVCISKKAPSHRYLYFLPGLGSVCGSVAFARLSFSQQELMSELVWMSGEGRNMWAPKR